MSAVPPEDILLDGYAAIRCPVKVHNQFDPTIELPGTTTLAVNDTAEHQAALFEARELVATVMDELAASPQAVDLRGIEDPAERLAATDQARREAAGVIIAPALPDDPIGGRRGSPHLLVRARPAADGGAGYFPVLIRHHRVLERHNRSMVVYASPVTTPLVVDRGGLLDTRLRAGNDEDLIHLAHYWRMLEAIGWTPMTGPRAGLIGTDEVSRTISPRHQADGASALRLAASHGNNTVHAIVWVDLLAKQIRTFSRTAAKGWKTRSPLERHDHEHAFRLKVARTARRRGTADDPPPMVRPIRVKECTHCPWWAVCAPAMGDDDLSRSIDKSPLDVREITVLRSLGISSVTDLVNADLDALMERYLPEVTHRDGAESRLRLAARRARLMAQGLELERIDDSPMRLPHSEVEIDWDIEAATGDRIYLWGFWVRDLSRDNDRGRYVWFGRFEEMTEQIENSVAIEAMTWLNDMLDTHPDARVYHYSDYEMVHLRKVARSSQDPQVLRAMERLRKAHVDLFSTMRKHWFGAHGLGLKAVATAAAGFEWRDDDPGGLNSQSWFREAVESDDPAKRRASIQRILDYNEDDVRATAALRDWLRAQD